ncbi:hypothetical protein HDE76_000532 [Rhodanobacter sp. ANJX3]|uniref:hypothetical protein n=3 Tax=unclassified Rhodanobacter TaxID=2621553 RepID=UPI001621028D|nr:hypothetical protein [Rhodanobacter sp. ANJX3]MBB5357350.1 hypothetical protein [Rhodanobacter sp. ANJX3]
MQKQVHIRLKPFSLRHRRLVEKGSLPDLSAQARRRLWITLREIDEPFYYSPPDNPGWNEQSSDIQEVEHLYARLLGTPKPESARYVGEVIEEIIQTGKVESALDVLECFLAWLDAERRDEAQTAINDVFRDYTCRWRMSDGQGLIVDDDFMEDIVLADTPPILALASFSGAKDEFQRARNELTEGNIRDAIFYAGASVESAFKAALGNSPKTGIDLTQAYANANLLEGLPKSKAQSL